MKRIRQLLEQSAFGVCHYLGDRIGVSSSRVRLYFIYGTFVALGSPILIYLVAAFWLNFKRYLRRSRQFFWQ
ncbi:MAG: PspC family transcriptional regulator [Lewinellaceae bacterium]|nr:PspC family transcriptional regulator [Lewinellaceae bacterium]